ncbi:EAL domain-containing protein [Novosphingobium sp. KCTC 2891]|uniref:putative bifunctional diguanylate cyclase/phosphodiesterase n=1 Tax=Novosphingobium sp. KCTC 2891 TaxID=2989730 RepID=UPI002222968E|nr:EAL domain-containing protein [Novosphingobium sp. KCTC 2891]MCW1382333.1 EAL domain-containing protein [Novosphingobium sp. KCTC 2891]
MRCPDRSPDEPDRLRALAEYRIEDEQALASLDAIVGMAARLFDCPGAAVNLVGEEQVFLVSSKGIAPCDFSRDASFCAHAMTQDGIMVVEDAALDPRFHDNPLVASGAIRFYAGAALRAPSGHALGALCVVDPEPHAGFSAQDRTRLAELARLVSDKLELRRLDVAAQARPARFKARAMTSPGAVVCFDEQGRITTCNPAAAALFGWAEADLVGAPVERLVAEADRTAVGADLRRVRLGNLPITRGTVLTAQRRDGSRFSAELHWSHWHEGERTLFGVLVQDLTDRLREEDALYHLAHFDPLTGLPNRALLMGQLDEAFDRRAPAALILTDLAGFADINNTLGQAVGDAVLRRVGESIRAVVPVAAYVARLGGDEFATVLPLRDPVAAAQVARDINGALARPMRVAGHEIHIGSHCGIALAPDQARTPDDLIGNAELALLQARDNGRGDTTMFMPHLRARAVARRKFEAELHHALGLGQFVLFYQPQVALADGALTGAEALIRWRHPQHGLLAPGVFLPALEASSIAGAVGCWVLDAACRQAALWRRANPRFGISVNLSAAQFRPGNLPAIVAGTLAAHGLPGDALELEITENIILDQQDTVLAQLRQIRALGVRLSFDDFGTGFASLNVLRNFPVSHIKIDKGFTLAMQTSAKDRAIVTGLIGMARDLGLEVIAEGVESAAAAQFLRRHGCHKAQGYHFGEPCTPGQFVDRYLRLEGESLRLAGG